MATVGVKELIKFAAAVVANTSRSHKLSTE